ncbi:mitochondrial import receptor subunit TOM40 homolog 1 [Macrosteles quadrilineatus]|uniref:mitochondrial import receptor subunit TOM40 homolog 1 n=1 Tax=Macrosteles quadrilineatus TaxID=74068 RepID=UPI0023E22F9E|nr:mitochondrial import receptor subunit TOM40 homolog 1 [Macrosteles quadrilineatus]
MGNVFAASKPPQDFGMFAMPPAPGEDTKEEVKIENPGTMEELHKKTKDVFPSVFDGARIVLNKGLSNHFQVSHNITLSSQQPGSYRFGATYVGTNQIGPGEVYPVLIGDIDSSGLLSANVFHQIGSRYRLRFQAQMSNSQFAVAQTQIDYKADTFTSSLSIINPDPLNNFQGVFVGHYLQNVTPNLALGAELAIQRMNQIPGGQLPLLSLAARYSGDDYVCSGTLGVASLHLCYYQKASEQLHIGVEMETNLRMQESVGTIGYYADLPKADLQFRGSVDTNWNVSAVIEKKLLPMPFTFTLSGNLNQKKNSFRLGLGFVIG